MGTENLSWLLALRPENTAGLVRAFVENGWYQPGQIAKYFYYGPMFRYERPQKGRQRQFTQFGAEILGATNPFLDFEIISLAISLLKQLGIENYVIKINCLGDAITQKKYQNELQKYYRKKIIKLCENCQKRYQKNVLRLLNVATILP